MQKVKVLSKDIENDGIVVNLKMSLIGDKSEYMVISETDDDISVINTGSNAAVADTLFNYFFNNDVLPETVNDIIGDMIIEKCAMHV